MKVYEFKKRETAAEEEVPAHASALKVSGDALYRYLMDRMKFHKAMRESATTEHFFLSQTMLIMEVEQVMFTFFGRQPSEWKAQKWEKNEG